jgi:hypothetical protein
MTGPTEGDEEMTSTASAVPPGTWLADVDRDVTVHIVNLINLAVPGLEFVKNRILIGVDADGDYPEQMADRVDDVRDSAREALRDLVVVRDLIALITATIAAVAIGAGSPFEEVCDWAAARDDPRILETIYTQLSGGLEPDLVALVHELASQRASSAK